MPIQMIECVICGQKVTKRSTLSLEVLGGGKGRACRAHEEVRKMVDEFEQKKFTTEATNVAFRGIQIIGAVCLVRHFATFNGIDPDAIYFRMRMNGVPEDFLEEVKAEVTRQGGPVMPEDEILTTVVGALEIFKRQQAFASQIN